LFLGQDNVTSTRKVLETFRGFRKREYSVVLKWKWNFNCIHYICMC